MFNHLFVSLCFSSNKRVKMRNSSTMSWFNTSRKHNCFHCFTRYVYIAKQIYWELHLLVLPYLMFPARHYSRLSLHSNVQLEMDGRFFFRPGQGWRSKSDWLKSVVNRRERIWWLLVAEPATLFQLWTRDFIRGFVRPSIHPSIRPSAP